MGRGHIFIFLSQNRKQCRIKIIHSFIHSFIHQHLLSTYYVPGFILECQPSGEQSNPGVGLHGAYSLWEGTDDKLEVKEKGNRSFQVVITASQTKRTRKVG